MRLNQILDIVVVLCGVYASMSCLCSWIHERIASVLKLRGWNLFKGVLNLVGDHGIAAEIFNHPLLAAASTRPDAFVPATAASTPAARFVDVVKTRPPSYVDARNFSSALWQVIAQKHPAPAGAPDADQVTDIAKLVVAAPDSAIATLKNAVSGMTEVPALQKQLLGLLAQAGGTYDGLLAATDGWFNAQMDRVSGWYKRQTQLIMIGIAFVVISLSGVDTLEMVRTLSVIDPKELTAIADTVGPRGLRAEPSPAATAAPATPRAAAPRAPAVPLAVAGATLPPLATPTLAPNAQGPGLTNGPSATQPFDITQFAHLHFDLWTNWGWRSTTNSRIEYARASGMMLTLVALALGGPFWFDALCSLANVRSAGRKPKRADQPPK